MKQNSIVKIFVLLSGFGLWAQVSHPFIKHLKNNATTERDGERAYMSSDGTLYVNKDNPISLTVKVGDLSFDIKTTENEHDFFLDEEGNNYIKSKWRWDNTKKNYVLPKEEISYKIVADGQPPYVEISNENYKKTFSNGETNYFGEGLKTQITVKDDYSGIRKIVTRLNGEIIQDPKKVFYKGRPSGKYTVEVRSWDNVSNFSGIYTNTFFYDVTPPQTQSSLEGNIFILNNQVIAGPGSYVMFGASDDYSGVSNIQYRFDEPGNFSVLKKDTANIPSLNEAKVHKLAYFSVDNVDNKSKTSEKLFYYDATPPKVSIMFDNFHVDKDNVTYISRTTKVSLLAKEIGAFNSGVRNINYIINDFTRNEYKQPFTLHTFRGENKILFTSYDNLGNTSKEKVKNVFVDTNAPNVSLEFLGDKYILERHIYISSKTKIKLSITDNHSGVDHTATKYSVQEGLEKTYEKPFLLEQEGDNYIRTKSFDNVKNEVENEWHVVLDKTSPNLIYNFSINPIRRLPSGINEYPIGTELYFSAKDNFSGIASLSYKFDDNLSHTKSKQGSVQLPRLEKGQNYHVIFTAVDNVGNTKKEEILFKIED